MAAHAALVGAGFAPRSFGVGSQVKMPGETQHDPNVYEFGTPYEDILRDLATKNRARYTANGTIPMIERDAGTKRAPERWQTERALFDIVFTYETRVFDIVVADLTSRASLLAGHACHVININTPDNHEQANVGAGLTLRFVELLAARGDVWEDSLEEIVQEYEAMHGKDEPVLHAVRFV